MKAAPQPSAAMDIAQLTLEYLKALVWPAVVAFLVIRYHGYVDRFLKRISEETDEINSSFLGLTAKFRKEMSALSTSLPADHESAKAGLQIKLREFAKDQFRVLSTGFFTKSLSERVRLAKEVTELSMDLSVEDLLDFSRSAVSGERVAAGIGLTTHIRTRRELARDGNVIEAIQRGLSDPQSRVRYRFVEALERSADLASRFKERLVDMAASDDNEVVRSLARQLLRHGD